jgi:hypothetical protein
MPFKIGDRTIPLDTPFSTAELQYPANWIRLATEEEKASIGLVWEAEPVRASDRFYWDGNIANPKALEDVLATKEDGSPLWVQVYDSATESMVDTDTQVVTKGLKSTFIAQNKATAGSILAQTDWAVTRKSDIGTDIPASIVATRLAVRQKSDQIEAAITACTTVAELASLDLSYPSDR